MKNQSIYDVIVVGAGIAGLSAALYLSRQGLKTLVISKDLGGQLLMAGTIENYPGIKVTSGADLTLTIEEQVKTFGGEFRYGDIVNKVVKTSDGRFLISTEMGLEYMCNAVILAFGKIPIRMGIEGEKEYDGKGVSYCSICDGPLYKGRVTAVVGRGIQGIDAVLHLSQLSTKIYYVTPVKLYGEEEHINAVRTLDNVEILEYHQPLKVVGDGSRVTGLIVKDLKKGIERELAVEGVFVELGYKAKTDFVKNVVELNERDEIIINKIGETSVEGIFAAGDVTDIPYKQAIISAGEGVKAALSAFSYIQRRRGRKGIVLGDWRKTGKVKKDKPTFKLGF